jgi:hypothetical protein
MSANTNYIVNGVGDLSTIFYPWDGTSPQATLTNLKIGTGDDLNTIFQSINYPPIPQPVTPFLPTNFYANSVDIGNLFLPLNYNNFAISILQSNGSYLPISILTASDGITQYTEIQNIGTFTIVVNEPSINLSYLMTGGGGSGGNGVINILTFQTPEWCCASGGGGGSGEIIYSNTSQILSSGTTNISFTLSNTGGTLTSGYISYNVSNAVTYIANSGGNATNAVLNYQSGITFPTSATGGTAGPAGTGGTYDASVTYYSGLSGSSGVANPPSGTTYSQINPFLTASGGNGSNSNINPTTFTFGGSTIGIGIGGQGAYFNGSVFVNSQTGIRGGGCGGGCGSTFPSNGADIGTSNNPYLLLYWTM